MSDFVSEMSDFVKSVSKDYKDLIIHNAKLIVNARNEVEALHEDLEIFWGTLRDISEKTGDASHEQEALVKKIMAIAKRAKDAVDDFKVEITRNPPNVGRTLINAVNPFSNILEIVKRTKEIRKEMEDMSNRNLTGTMERQDSQRGDNREVSSSINQRPTGEEDEVVGFNLEADKVIGLLTGGRPTLEPIGIVGMAGLGKTTLANKIFQDLRITRHFIHRAWVEVTVDGSAVKVLDSILEQMLYSRERIDSIPKADLAAEVAKALKNKRYLVVLDDVWTRELWDSIKFAFPKDQKGSRILLTTRDTNVARYANPSEHPHNLKYLTEGESWQLLQIKVFGRRPCPEYLERVGFGVAKNCGGLPLAIVVIACTLQSQLNAVHWEYVASTVNEHIVKDETKFMKVVQRSYNSLHENLKHCFLYFGILPRGEIPVWKLILLWISEGFVDEDFRLGLERLEAAAAERLDKLVESNLVMVSSRKSNDSIKTCRVHDTLRVFCRTKSEKLGLNNEINMSNIDSLGKYLRVSVTPDVVLRFPQNPSPPCESVRTVLNFDREGIALDNDQFNKMFNAFKRLQVLEFSTFSLTQFPMKLAEMALLRYLAFSCNFKSMPSSISNLRLLHTLIIIIVDEENSSERRLEFCHEIWKLDKLRHLITKACSVVLPSPLASVPRRENIQTLSDVSPESCTEALFSLTPKLQKLGVRGDLADLLKNDDKLAAFEKLEHLRKLKLFNVSSNSSVTSLSTRFPNRLKELTLSGTNLGWKKIIVLGGLDELVVLKLKENAFVGDVWDESELAKFPKLRILYIDRARLKTWDANDVQFQRLERLVLKNCSRLEAIPSRFNDLSSFQSLEIWNSSPSVKSARELERHRGGPEGGFKLFIYPPQD